MKSLTWSRWIAIDADLGTYKLHIPASPGFYRIRAKDSTALVYIGQTGRSLLLRTRGELARNVVRPLGSPPWNDPHTAAPLLWAYRHESGMEFEVSVAACDLPNQLRQCHEDALLYLHRQEFGHSTLCNHGRRHPLWTRASNRKDARPTTRLVLPVEYPSLQVATGESNPLAADWLGLAWSEFHPLVLTAPSAAGVYRILDGGEVVYLGESKTLRSRIGTHAKDPRFRNCLVSYCSMANPQPHQLKERETDLIGAYILATDKAPRYQYKPNAELDSTTSNG
jgi:hypothetical protein